MERVTLEITGMTCGHCVGAVSKALRGLGGVEVESIEVGTATLTFDPSRVSRAQLDAAVAEEGYQVVGAA